MVVIEDLNQLLLLHQLTTILNPLNPYIKGYINLYLWHYTVTVTVSSLSHHYPITVTVTVTIFDRFPIKISYSEEWDSIEECGGVLEIHTHPFTYNFQLKSKWKWNRVSSTYSL